MTTEHLVIPESEQQQVALQLVLEPADNARLANVCGQFDEHLKQIERRLAVSISNRGNQFKITGDHSSVHAAIRVLEALYQQTEKAILEPADVHLYLQESGLEEKVVKEATEADKERYKAALTVKTPRVLIKPRGKNQQNYLKDIKAHDINFGIGPAGTGKTYLAVACAIEALQADKVRRLVLTRPAVEAGENLGFLPGDLTQKIDPYLRPLYDALYEMMGFDTVAKLIDRNVIEIAPLAFMRGRTLNESFIILDEAQNTTREQMKMFLTRIGFGSTAVITGDLTQVDLPRGKLSGLRHSVDVLDNVNGISVSRFISKDVVRHPLVQRIVDAYETADVKEQQLEQEKKAAEKAAKDNSRDND